MTFLRRVKIQNYRSIAGCSVELHPLTFLVGPNGSGKSNFLDALRFTADGLRTSLDHALRDRGGIKEVRRRSSGHPTHFGIRLDFELPSGEWGYYAFRIGARAQGGFEVQQEACEIVGPEPLTRASYEVQNGTVVHTSVKVAPAAAPDRLYLVAASGLPEFRPVYEAFTHMGFYNLNPDRIRDLQSPDAGDLLTRDGSNLASVLSRLETQSPEGKQLIEEFLSKVVPGVRGVVSREIGPKETLEFRQDFEGTPNPWRFLAASMSDGTLRALGILVALFQPSYTARDGVLLVGIEEPEVALHPAAAGVLRDGLRHAAEARQVLVTSHSPDLLDDPELDPASILAVTSEQGVTRIGPIDAAGRQALRSSLYTAGELLRLNQLQPDPVAAEVQSASQLRLFAEDTPPCA